MALDNNEVEERENWETSKQKAIVVRDWGYTALTWSGAVCAFSITIAVVFFLIPALHSWKGVNNEYAAATAAAAPKLTNAMGEVLTGATSFRMGMANLEGVTLDLKGISADVRDNYLPGSFSNIDDTVRALRIGLINPKVGLLPALTGLAREGEAQLTQVGGGLTDAMRTVDDGLRTNLATLNDNQLALGRGIARVTDHAVPEIIAFANKLNQVGDKLKVYVDDPTIADDLKKANAILGNLEVVTAGTARVSTDVADWTHKALFPPPQKGVKGFLKKYVLTPILVGGKVAALYVTVAKGL